MKKIILAILISTMIIFNLCSLDHGLITGFDIGYNLSNVKVMEKNRSSLYKDLSGSISLELKTGYRIENLRIIGTYTNTILPIKLDNFNPIEDNFRIDISYTFKNLTIGGYNSCTHSMETQADPGDITINFGQRALYIKYYKEF